MWENGETYTYEVVRRVLAVCECGRWQKEGDLNVETKYRNVSEGTRLYLEIVAHHRLKSSKGERFGHTRVEIRKNNVKIEYVASSSSGLIGEID